jgi:hypothetical protein
MAFMTPDQLRLFKDQLNADYVQDLPPLLGVGHPPDHMVAKNISRALSAFAIHKLVGTDRETAAKAVIDDYEDNGIDALFYNQATKQLFFVQSKLRPNEPFAQAEANAFKEGVKDLLNERYNRFNQNLIDRQEEIEAALDDADEMILVIAHASPEISQHAKDILNNFLNPDDCPDERLVRSWVDYGPEKILSDFLDEQAVDEVYDQLRIYGVVKINDPRSTYYGRVSVKDLASLYSNHQDALFEKNIRYFLGVRSSAVNREIQESLGNRANEFIYLNNGVTAIAHEIRPRRVQRGGRNFQLDGLSVINGAQTIASCAQFINENPEADVDSAFVMFTLIHVDRADPFGGRVTRARNHQNPISPNQFASLDSTQERLRRELAFLNIVYRYRPEARTWLGMAEVITINEAAFALALLRPDPNIPVALKRESSKYLLADSREYQSIFTEDLSGKRLANAVRLYRAAEEILNSNESAAIGQEKWIYRHGRYAILWLLLSRHQQWLDRDDVMSADDAGVLVSPQIDEIREKVRSDVIPQLAASYKGPLGFFRNLTLARPFIVRMRDELNGPIPHAN